jgi:hypothetical protein
MESNRWELYCVLYLEVIVLLIKLTISVRAGVASFQILPLKFLMQERPTLQLAEY